MASDREENLAEKGLKHYLKKITTVFLILNFAFMHSALAMTAEDRNTAFKSFSFQPNNFLKQNINQDDLSASPEGREFIPDSSVPLTDYKLSSGDVVQVNILSTDAEFTHNLSVSPEGKIFVPKIGEFNVTEITTTELRNRLKLKIKNSEVSVLLKRIKSIKVYLTGFIANPGSYTLTYGTRLMELLRKAGGLSDNGSVRNITITSPDNKKTTYDIYNFVYGGSLEANPMLNAGDRIFIPFIENSLAIMGNVVNPGVYEFKSSDKVSDLLRLAGGYTSGAALENILLWKNGMNKLSDFSTEFTISSLNVTAGDTVNNGDILYIPALKMPQDDRMIHIYGQVNREGSLPFKEGMKLSDYLKQSGGSTQTANLEAVKVTRIVKGPRGVTSETFTVNADDILYKGNTGADIYMQVNDVVYVPEKFFNFRNFSDISNLVLSTLGIISLVLSFTRN